MIETLLILLLCVALFFSALLSCSETALFSLSGTRASLFQHSADTRERLISDLLKKPQDLMVTILMLNVTTNICVQNIVSAIFGEDSGWILTTMLPLLLTLLLGDSIPKSIGIVRSEAVCRRVAGFLFFVRELLEPLRRFFNVMTTFFSRYLLFFLKKDAPLNLDELKHVLHDSKEKGVIAFDELRLLCGYLELNQMTIKELVRPRGEILSYNLHEPLDHLIYLFVDQQCSRVPVHTGDIDKVIGIISAHHFLLHRDKIQTSADLYPYLRKPLFVPEGLIAHRTLQRFEEVGEKMALAVDAHGSVIGLVTREDLIEVLVGQIEDKRDESVDYTQISPNAIVASARMEIPILEEFFGIELPNPEHAATLGGWLIGEVGFIPSTGYVYRDERLLIQVIAALPHRLKTLYVQSIGKTAGKEHG